MKGRHKPLWIILVILLVLLVLFTKKQENNVERDNVGSKAGDSFFEKRQYMVEYDLKSRDIADENVLKAMGKVPRHLFVPEILKNSAYEDNPLPIGYGQTISQPYIVALMTQSLKLDKGGKVLEIGTGSGYQAAVLSELVKEVYTIEIIKELAEGADQRLKNSGYRNIEVKHGDGYFGWKEKGPFDAIMVTAAVNHVPPPLLEQLKDNGRLILPLGDTLRFQTLTLITKKGDKLESEFITSVAFVPLTGEAEKRG